MQLGDLLEVELGLVSEEGWEVELVLGSVRKKVQVSEQKWVVETALRSAMEWGRKIF